VIRIENDGSAFGVLAFTEPPKASTPEQRSALLRTVEEKMATL